MSRGASQPSFCQGSARVTASHCPRSAVSSNQNQCSGLCTPLQFRGRAGSPVRLYETHSALPYIMMAPEPTDTSDRQTYTLKRASNSFSSVALRHVHRLRIAPLNHPACISWRIKCAEVPCITGMGHVSRQCSVLCRGLNCASRSMRTTSFRCRFVLGG